MGIINPLPIIHRCLPTVDEEQRDKHTLSTEGETHDKKGCPYTDNYAVGTLNSCHREPLFLVIQSKIAALNKRWKL